MPITNVKESWWKRTSDLSRFWLSAPGYVQSTRTPPQGRYWWYYNGVVWTTDDASLQSGEIKALLDGRIGKERRRLARSALATGPKPIKQVGRPDELREAGGLTAHEFKNEVLQDCERIEQRPQTVKLSRSASDASEQESAKQVAPAHRR